MLVLSRKIGEQITVGNSVMVTVLSFDRTTAETHLRVADLIKHNVQPHLIYYIYSFITRW